MFVQVDASFFIRAQVYWKFYIHSGTRLSSFISFKIYEQSSGMGEDRYKGS